MSIAAAAACNMVPSRKDSLTRPRARQMRRLCVVQNDASACSELRSRSLSTPI
jgi:hypothetical protein